MHSADRAKLRLLIASHPGSQAGRTCNRLRGSDALTRGRPGSAYRIQIGCARNSLP